MLREQRLQFMSEANRLTKECNKSQKEQLSHSKYDPPYSAKQVKEKYGEEMYERLRKDPAHRWRMDRGIELIHREPTLKELKRIKRN